MAKKQASLGCLFWIAIVLLIIVVVLFNVDKIKPVIEKVGLDKWLEKTFYKEAPSEPMTTNKPLNVVAHPSPTPVPAVPQKTPAPTEAISLEVQKPVSTPSPKPVEKNPNRRNAKIYYVSINDAGLLVLKDVARTVYFSDSPLTATLQALMEGPTQQEASSGFHNLIPPDSKILGISVKQNVAYINFNEAFRFNTLGGEGLQAQLKQIVYTATEFSNVSGVQFLIEGKKEEYLGPEGGYIGGALRRDSL